MQLDFQTGLEYVAMRYTGWKSKSFGITSSKPVQSSESRNRHTWRGSDVGTAGF
jgi:hypothetical protein